MSTRNLTVDDVAICSDGPEYNIWTYWDEDPIEDTFVLKCLDNWSAMNKSLKIVVLNDRTIDEHIQKPKPANFGQLAAVVRSVWCRDQVIYEQGGFWLDTTVILFKPLQEIHDMSADFSGVRLHDWVEGGGQLEPHRGADWFFFAPKGSILLGEFRKEVDTILQMDPNEWCDALRAANPRVQFHALPYYWNGWALWKTRKALEEEQGHPFKFSLHDNLTGAYSYLMEGNDAEAYRAQFPVSHCQSKPLDPVSFGMPGGNTSTPEITPGVDKDIIWKTLFQMPQEEFFATKPDTFCAKFTAPGRSVLQTILFEKSAREVNPDSVFAKYIHNYEQLFAQRNAW